MMTNTRTIYLAFPGMGKTTYAKTHNNVIDLDFGFIRSAFTSKTMRNDKQLQYQYFRRLALEYAKAGWTILSNEPALVPYLKQDGFTIIIEVPSDVDNLVNRVVARDGNTAFTRDLQRNASEWVQGWIETASKYQLPLVKGKYFKEVNMPYEEEIK